MRLANRSRRGGVTLVELFVVIRVIAVVIGILLPPLRKARMAAQMTQCQNNVRQLYTGILNYCNDNHDWYPTCAAPADGVAYAWYADDWIWWENPRAVDDSPVARYL